MAGRVQDKVTIITGGASGIGEGMVLRPRFHWLWNYSPGAVMLTIS
ncbi:MAG: hypothetical protein O7F73_14920 [Gammaproteobacteria bacterium]|nr:hypothetical protein [Gammaproteobacteria bacterium]